MKNNKQWIEEFKKEFGIQPKYVETGGYCLDGLQDFIQSLLDQQAEQHQQELEEQKAEFLELLNYEIEYKNTKLHGHDNKNILIRNRLRKQLREKVESI